MDADPDATADLVASVDEAATNIIVHGYRKQPGEILIEVSRDGEFLIARLRDQAAPFDPTQAIPPDLALPLEERPVGGMGIHMMRQYTDQMIYRKTSQGTNELTLVKKAFFSSMGEEE